MPFKFKHLAIPEVMLIQPDIRKDTRGYFLETYRHSEFLMHGIPQLVQDNHSFSKKGVLRGLHYQLKNPQGKLIRVLEGEVLDVVVDIRRGSPTHGKSVSVKLSGENHLQLYCPPGFAHGFIVLSDTVHFLYQCTEYYHPEDEFGILWSDPSLGIDWNLNGLTPIVSPRDTKLLPLKAIHYSHLPKF